jgi:hypothetical protein
MLADDGTMIGEPGLDEIGVEYSKAMMYDV